MPADNKSRSRLVQQTRSLIFSIYGPACARCGIDLSEIAWECNHIFGRRWSKPARKVSSYQRNLRYLHEAMQGLIEVTCPECNAAYRPPHNAQPPPTHYVCPKWQAWMCKHTTQPF